MEAGCRKLVVHHLQAERVLVALHARQQHALAGGLGGAGHVAVERRQYAPGDRGGAMLALGVDLPRFGEHVDAPQRRSDDLRVQRGRRDAILDRGGDRALRHLRVAAFQRRGECLQRALHERLGVGAKLFAGVRPGAAEHFHERVQQHRVEVAAALFAHHLHGILDGEGLAVDAVAGQRVEHVRNCHDPALDRDRLAFQAPRVAGPVPLLLMAEGDRRRHVQDRGGRAAHQAVALLRVGLHDRALLRRERPGLQQDRVGDRHLADVVQRRGVPQALAKVGVHADVFGQQHREASDPLYVRAGVLVAELDRHRQPLHGLRLSDLQLRQGPFELVGAVLDLLFQGRLGVLAEAPSQRDRRAGERHQAGDHGQRRSRHDRADDRSDADQSPRHEAEGRVAAPDAPAWRTPAGAAVRGPLSTHERTDPRACVACCSGSLGP